MTDVFRVAGRSALLLWALTGQALGQELVFASAEESRRILATQDVFVARLSPFDRSARLKTDRDVPAAEFLEFVASAVLEWQPHEKKTVDAAFREIRSALARLPLPLPGRINVIKTTGREEGNAAYTRGDAIVFPAGVLDLPAREMQRVLAHELFHVASRAYPSLARPLYDAIGFRYCGGEVEFPAHLAQRKITNPDAPVNDYCVRLQVGGQTVWAVPILFSSTAKYDPARGGEFFRYLQLGFLLVQRTGATSAPRPLRDAQGVRVVSLQSVSGFFEQVGRNTDEIVHPEEIVADNVALLVLGERGVASPEVLARIETALANAGPAASRATREPSRTPRH